MSVTKVIGQKGLPKTTSKEICRPVRKCVLRWAREGTFRLVVPCCDCLTELSHHKHYINAECDPGKWLCSRKLYSGRRPFICCIFVCHKMLFFFHFLSTFKKHKLPQDIHITVSTRIKMSLDRVWRDAPKEEMGNSTCPGWVLISLQKSISGCTSEGHKPIYQAVLESKRQRGGDFSLRSWGGHNSDEADQTSAPTKEQDQILRSWYRLGSGWPVSQFWFLDGSREVWVLWRALWIPQGNFLPGAVSVRWRHRWSPGWLQV